MKKKVFIIVCILIGVISLALYKNKFNQVYELKNCEIIELVYKNVYEVASSEMFNEPEEEIDMTVSNDIINKYNKLSYKSNTELETLVSCRKRDFSNEKFPDGTDTFSYIDVKFEISDKRLKARSLDGKKYEDSVVLNSEDMNKDIVVEGLYENVYAVTDFYVVRYGAPTFRIAALTTTGNLYIANEIQSEDDELVLKFEKVQLDNKIIGMFINESYEEFNDVKNVLYVLTDENELRILNGYSVETSELGNKYEERIINYSPHENFGFSHIAIYKSDDTAEVLMVNNETSKIQYNGKILKIKALFLKLKDDYSRLYVIDTDGNIYETKKSIPVIEVLKQGSTFKEQDLTEYYELKLYNNKKVKNIEFYGDYEKKTRIEYTDGTIENIDGSNIYSYKAK